MNNLRTVLHAIGLILFIGMMAPSFAGASWNLATPNAVVDFDYLPGYGGLIGFRAPGSVAIWKNGLITGTLPVNTKMGTVAIFDSNIAYAHVDGNLWVSKKGWTEWTMIEQNSEHVPIGRAAGRILFRTPLGSEYLIPGSSFQPTAGLLAMLSQVEQYNSTTVFARDTLLNVYRSTDKGSTYTKLAPTNVLGIYADEAGGVVYVSTPTTLLASYDKGTTFSAITPPPFAEYDLKGPIAGSHDCSGALYVHSADFIRSLNHGATFQKIGQGPAPPASTTKVFVYGRGANLILLTKFGSLYESHNGSDGTLSDTLSPNVSVSSSRPLGQVCGASVAGNVRFFSSTCSPLVLDRATRLSGSGAFALSISGDTLRDSLTTAFTFKPSTNGRDSAFFRLSFHSADDRKRDYFDFAVYGTGMSAPAVVKATPDRVDFEGLLVGTTLVKKLNLTNVGCDTLRIISVTSTDSSVFKTKDFSARLVSGKSREIEIVFSPKEKKKYVESLEVLTNVGTSYITLVGAGTELPSNSVEDTLAPLNVWPNPASTIITLEGLLAGSNYAIFSYDGRRIAQGATSYHDNGSISVDVSRIPSGSYVLRIDGLEKRIIILH